MAGYHITPSGDPGKCSAKLRCPYGDMVKDHFKNPQLAREAFEVRVKQHTLPQLRKVRPINERALSKIEDPRYPKEILQQMGALLDREGLKPAAVIPFGSSLYGTQLPDSPIHDYDFIVFTEPDAAVPGGYYQYLEGDLDVTVIPVDKLPKHFEKSIVTQEAFMAYKHGHSLYSPKTNAMTKALLDSTVLPTQRILATMSSFDRSRGQAFSYPPDLSDKNEKKNFKHAVRRELYRRRLLAKDAPSSLDPQLTPEEQGLFFEAMKTGRFEAFEDSFTGWPTNRL